MAPQITMGVRFSWKTSMVAKATGLFQ